MSYTPEISQEHQFTKKRYIWHIDRQAMYTETLTPDEEARAKYRLEFARAWMARKRQEQQEMIDSFHTDPAIVAAFEELKRRNTERGTTIIEL